MAWLFDEEEPGVLDPQQQQQDQQIDPRRMLYAAALQNIGNIAQGQAPQQSLGSVYSQAKNYNNQLRNNQAAQQRQQEVYQREQVSANLADEYKRAQTAKLQKEASSPAGQFAGTGIEAQMLNKYLSSLPENERAQAEQEIIKQRLERSRTTITPEGTYTQPGYSLREPQAQPGQPPMPQQQPMQQPMPPQTPQAFTAKPMSATEAKASGFLDRMEASQVEADRVLEENPDFDPSSTRESMAASLPGVGNMMVSPAKQQYMQASLDWVRSKLRWESGAVISEQEAKDEYKNYFPVPGDSTEVIEQKRRARRQAESAMRDAAGAQRRKESPEERFAIDPAQTPGAVGLAAEDQGVIDFFRQ